MKRDLVIAIIIGFISGALVAATLLNLPFLLQKLNNYKNGKQSSQTISTVSPTPTSLSTIVLDISQPKDNEIATTKNATVIGKTQTQNFVVIENESNQDVRVASADGSFSFPITLSLGSNDVTLTVYNKNGDSLSKTITVLYLDEKL